MAEKATHFRSERSKDTAVIHVEGDFTYEHTGTFNALVKKIIGECDCAPKIKLDLGDCRFIDSGCMGTIAHVQKELSARGGELQVVNAQPLVLEAMRRIRLDSIVPVKGKKK